MTFYLWALVQNACFSMGVGRVTPAEQRKTQSRATKEPHAQRLSEVTLKTMKLVCVHTPHLLVTL